MKNWLKTTLTIIGASILGMGVTFGAMYAVYAVQDNKHTAAFNDAVSLANSKIDQLKLNDSTYDNFVSLSKEEIVLQVTASIADIKTITPSVNVTQEIYNKDGSVNVTIDVDYTSNDYPSFRQHKTFEKTFHITDSTPLKWSVYNLDVQLKPQYLTNHIHYREFTHINENNLDNYITFEKDPSLTYTFKGEIINNNIANPFINKEQKTLNFYINVKDTTESINTNLKVFHLNVDDPVLLTKTVVDANYNAGGIWETKTILTPEDYSEYDIIQQDAFDNHGPDELVLPANIDIIENGIESITFKTINKISLLEESDTSSLFIKDNILYSRIIANDPNIGNVLVMGAMSIADRTLAVNELRLFDSIFMQPYKDQSVDTFIGSYFYDANAFKNVKKINLEDSHVSSIGIAAFKNCAILSNNIQLSSNNLSSNALILDEAFYGTNITSFRADFTKSSVITSISNSSFEGCSQLTTVDISYSSYIMSIRPRAFYNCNQLSNINIVRIAPTTTYCLDLFIAAIKMIMFIVWIGFVSMIAIMFALTILPISIGSDAFGSDDIVPLNRTIKIGGIYTLILDPNAFVSKFQTTELYLNDIVVIDESNPESNKISLLAWQLESKPNLFDNITSLHIYQQTNSADKTFDINVYPPSLQPKIVAETNPIK